MRRRSEGPITVYQKPTCSKCRATLSLLKERGVEFDAVNYYERPLKASELRSLISKMGVGPREILRTGEPAYRDLVKNRDLSDDELIDLMVKNPDLIQRPIVVRGEEAVLCRPPENVERLL
ncbi:MAG TPA: arsenate reductase (glutaredoxin) [Blastocatellia bacterium]|nr:arsenate reductase (glutaredoxin) [Blastocatellia bacterium]